MVNSIINSYIGFWKNVLDLFGRTNRFDFWVPSLINFLIFGSISAALANVSQTIAGIVGFIYAVASITILVRRVRDAGHSGWLTLLGLVPVIGWIILLVFCIQPSK